MAGKRFDLLANLERTKDRAINNRTDSIRRDWTKDSLRIDNIHRITRRNTYNTISNSRRKVFTPPKYARVTAYVQLFIMKLRKITTPEGAISAEDMERARMRWIKYLQVINGEATIKKEVSKIYLNPRLDTAGIVSCYGRLINTIFSEEIITPILLPRRERFAQLLIVFTSSHFMLELTTPYSD